MTVAELHEWRIYESIEPFGDRRRDLQTAQLMALLFNLQRTKNTDKISKPADWMPDWDAEPKKPQTADEQLDMMRMLASAQNALVKNRELAN